MKVDHDTSQPAVACQARILAETLSLGHRDTNPLRIPRYHRTLGEEIPSPEHPGTNRHLHHPVLPKEDTRIRSRGGTVINLPLRPDSRPRRPTLLRLPRTRVMSSPMWV